MEALADKVALVTGAGGGIGLATATLLAGSGATLALVDVAGDAVNAAATELTDKGGHAAPYVVDLGDTALAAGLVDRVVTDLGRVDILVNNAGVTGSGSLLDISEQAWDRTMAINLKAPFLLTQAFGRHAAQRSGGGKIVNVLSSSLFRAMFLSGPDYVVSKGGLLGLTRASAAFLAEFDVNVNAVVPGLTDTARQREPGESDEAYEQKMRDWISHGPLANPFKRVSVPEDVAEAILYLCSPGSRQVTGQVLHTSAGSVV